MTITMSDGTLLGFLGPQQGWQARLEGRRVWHQQGNLGNILFFGCDFLIGAHTVGAGRAGVQHALGRGLHCGTHARSTWLITSKGKGNFGRRDGGCSRCG
jgi:hypothetical protein